MNEKQCTKCKQIKNVSEFGKHTRHKDGLDYQCKSCIKEYINANRESLRKAYKKYYYAHRKQEIAEAQKLWYLRNKKEIPQKILALLPKKKESISYNDYKEIANIRTRKYKRNNREKMNLEYKKYSATSKGKECNCLKSQRYRARKMSTENTLTSEGIKFLFGLQSGKCGCCGKEFSTIIKYELDHIIPVTAGGGLTLDNTQLLCRSCNASKGTKTIRYIPTFMITNDYNFV